MTSTEIGNGESVTIPELENAVSVFVATTNTTTGQISGSVIVREKLAEAASHTAGVSTFSFPTATEFRVDDRGRAQSFTTLTVLRPVLDAGGTLGPDQAASLDAIPQGGTKGQIIAKASEADYDTEWVDAPEGGGGGEPITITDHYVHIGTPDLNGSNDGVLGSNNITPSGANTVTDFNVRFDNTLPMFNVPTDANYEPTNGNITLPAGHWIICASLNVVSSAATNSRVAAVLSINHGIKPKTRPSIVFEK